MRLFAALLLGVLAPAGLAAASSGFGGKQYTVPVYHGPIARPNFTSSGGRYSNLRTVISQAFRKGAKFAGHYTIISVGCGADCTMVLVGDVRSGNLFPFPVGMEGYPGLDISFAPDSTFAAARWVDGPEQTHCFVQQYVLTAGKFIPHGRRMKLNGPCYAE